MTIKSSQVKELREKTGVGMMECKKALTENDGDIEKAVLWLRERGLSRAEKKAGRVTAEGMVETVVANDGSRGAIIELNCETDFVSKNDDFRSFAAKLAAIALETKATSAEDLLKKPFEGEETVEQALTRNIATIGENLQLRRVDYLESKAGTVVGYSHMGGKIGSLVQVDGATGESVVELAKDIAMHIAAAAPRYLTSDQVSAEEMEQEKDLARKKLAEQNKPDNLIEKILAGQMNKFYKEICLIEQAFVKDPAVSIKKLVSNKAPDATLAGFARYQLGEGIEKKKDNFAEEVAAAAKLN